MEAEVDGEILRRIEKLECQVKAMMDEQGELEKSSAEVEIEFEGLVAQMDSYSLQRVLRDVSRERWAMAFGGLRKPAMEKLKTSVSRNVWNEFIETWSMGLQSRRSSQEEFIKTIKWLESMGEIAVGQLEPEVGFGKLDGEDLGAAMEKWKVRDEALTRKRREEAQEWMRNELAGLI
jgi:flagellar motor switch protein FliG